MQAKTGFHLCLRLLYYSYSISQMQNIEYDQMGHCGLVQKNLCPPIALEPKAVVQKTATWFHGRKCSTVERLPKRYLKVVFA